MNHGKFEEGKAYLQSLSGAASSLSFPWPSGPLPPMGTGLSNIKAAAEKYHGTMLVEKTDAPFSLHVLLNIS